MAERGFRPPPLRLVVGIALVTLGFAEVQSILVSLRAHTRLRERAADDARGTLAAGLPQLRALAAPGTVEAFASAARFALERLGAAEFEIIRPEERNGFAQPAPSPVRHGLAAPEMGRVAAGEVVAVGPLQSEASVRVLAYARVAAAGQPVMVRLATPVPDVVEDLRERDRLFLTQATVLVVLLVAAALAFVPGRPSPDAPSAGALDAYEQAMGRLREREEEMSRAHGAERETMARRVREHETLARAGELTAGIAHEMRNGLGTIVGYARLIERAGGASAEAARSIREECEGLELVVRRFVDYVRDEKLAVAAFDLSRLVSRVVAREHRDASADIAVEDPAPVIVEGDEDLLERAVENLVRNARQAVGPHGRVRVKVEQGTFAVRVRVRDDGPGLPAELRDGIRPFFTTKPGGLGLGLAMVQKLVRLHGGELSFVPVSPRGTEAIVSLPVRREATT